VAARQKVRENEEATNRDGDFNLRISLIANIIILETVVVQLNS
jgi:hypothetical protein